MAGLRARTAEHEAKLPASEPTPAPEGPAVPPVPVATAEAEGDDGGKVPRAKPLWARFLAASLVIVISMAAATAISLLVYLTDIAEGPRRQRRAGHACATSSRRSTAAPRRRS